MPIDMNHFKLNQLIQVCVSVYRRRCVCVCGYVCETVYGHWSDLVRRMFAEALCSVWSSKQVLLG